jgi:hypothetical protein
VIVVVGSQGDAGVTSKVREDEMDNPIGKEIYGRLWRVFAHHTAGRLSRVVGEQARVETRLVRIRFATA